MTNNDPARPWKWVFFAASAVFLLTSAVARMTGVSAAEEQVYRAATSVVPNNLTFRFISRLGSEAILFPAAFLLIVLLPREFLRRWWVWVAVMLATSILEGWGKDVIGRPRPEAVRPGFPSGHTATAAAFYTMACYLVQRALQSRLVTYVAYGAAAVVIGAVGLSRIALRVHWPLDVVGGAALGLAIVAGAAWWHERHPSSSRSVIPDARRALVYRSQSAISVALIGFVFLWAPMAPDDSFVDLLCDVSGVTGIVFGLGLRLWGAAHAGTTTTLADALPSRLVTTGPYAYMRQPVPLSVLLIAVGLVLLAESGPGLVILPGALILLFRITIPVEEAHLARTFGADYAQYRRRVPIWPRLTSPIGADVASALGPVNRAWWHAILRQAPAVAVAVLLAILAETDFMPRPFR